MTPDKRIAQLAAALNDMRRQRDLAREQFGRVYDQFRAKDEAWRQAVARLRQYETKEDE